MYQGHRWHGQNSMTTASLLHLQSQILEPAVNKMLHANVKRLMLLKQQTDCIAIFATLDKLDTGNLFFTTRNPISN